jgi:UDP-3-O-[3-hydroxymyristoyl] glucosamine N-acyltransferase
MSEPTAAAIADVVGEVIGIFGDPGRSVSRPAPLANAGEGTLAFCAAEGPNGELGVRSSAASIVLCRDEPWAREPASRQTLIVVPEPRLAFARALRSLFTTKRPTGVHETAAVHPDAKLGTDVYIGPYTYVDAASVGDGSVIHGHCHIHAGVTIGARVTIQAGSTIGIEGFSVQKNERGEPEWFPQLGTVVIEDDVDLGAHSNIQRGTLGPTRIGQGTKIDSFVHVGHNSDIGRFVVITAQAFLGGSVTIGDYAWIGPGAILRDGGITVGSRALVGLGAVVTKDVPAEETVLGVPARSLEEFRRLQASLRLLAGGE